MAAIVINECLITISKHPYLGQVHNEQGQCGSNEQSIGQGWVGEVMLAEETQEQPGQPDSKGEATSEANEDSRTAGRTPTSLGLCSGREMVKVRGQTTNLFLDTLYVINYILYWCMSIFLRLGISL